MNVTIVHNPTAGDGLLDGDMIVDAVRAAGHEATYRSTKSMTYRRGLQEAGDVVLVAGGDGTFRRVAKQLRGSNVPLLLLPLGTANNMARTLGLGTGIEECMDRLSRRKLLHMDAGACAGGVNGVFFEGAGFGVVPELIRTMDRLDRGGAEAYDQHEVDHARQVLERIIALAPPFACEIRSGDTVIRERMLLLQVMNVQSVGPRLPLAPDADPADGLLDIVWVEESQRPALRDWVQHRNCSAGEEPFSGRLRTAAAVVAADAHRVHRDDRLKKVKGSTPVTFTCEPGVLDVCV